MKMTLVLSAVCLIFGSISLAFAQQRMPPAREDCIPYNAARLEVINKGEKGWLLTDDGGNHWMAWLDNEADAEAALVVAKQHNKMCFIGRNNRRSNRRNYIIQYWK